MTTKPINEALFKKMWHEGKPYNAIGRAVGMDRSGIPKRAAMMGLPLRETDRNKGRHVAKIEIDRDRALEMWTARLSLENMARELHCSKDTIRARVLDWGFPDRPAYRTPRKFVPVPVAKPKPKPEPKAAPVYHPGLSAAIKRAGSSVQRLGQVATMFKMPYREVMEMAGVQG